MPHRFLDHTADVAADLDGRSAGELFASAMQALTDTMTPLETVRPLVTQSVTLEAPTLEDLLVDWLNELLYPFEVHDMRGYGFPIGGVAATDASEGGEGVVSPGGVGTTSTAASGCCARRSRAATSRRG
jgi:hypothetical protein